MNISIARWNKKASLLPVLEVWLMLLPVRVLILAILVFQIVQASAQVLSEVIDEEYPELLYNKDIAIKISGCMNSCGQHGMASIGFHGSSLKSKGQVLPALQVLIGGGIMGHGDGSIADKVIKVPSKRGPDVLRFFIE